MFSAIIVPLDLEAEGDRALGLAAALARAGGLPLELVTVSSPGMPEGRDLYGLDQRAATVGVDCRSSVLHDNDVAGALVAFAEDRPGALVVMASRARGLLGQHVLGSVSEAVLARLHQPVLLVGPHVAAEDTAASRTLVVGVGDTEAAALAGVVASWQRSFDGPRPWLVQVLPPTEGSGGSYDLIETGDVERLAAQLRGRGVDADWDVAHARHPAQALADYADRITDTVIVVASLRWADPAHSHLRSVARKLAQRAEHPVLVVPAMGARTVAVG